MGMSSRAQTKKELETLKRTLSRTVSEITNNVELSEELQPEDMAKIISYAHQKFDNRFRINGSVVHYDIAFLLVKDQLSRQLNLSINEKSLLLDGVMGWLFYNPGNVHLVEMNLAIEVYTKQFGVSRLRSQFRRVSNILIDYGKRGHEAITLLTGEAANIDNGWVDMFYQYATIPLIRRNQLSHLGYSV